MEMLKTLFVTQFFGIIARLLGWFPGEKIGFGGNQPKNVMIDWSRNARTGVYQLINQRIDYEAASKNVTSLFLGIVIPNHFSLLKEPEPAIHKVVSWLREKGLNKIG